MIYKHITVDDSIGQVGAEIAGVDLSKPLTSEARDEIHFAWLQHHVLFFRDQELTPTNQADFAAHFGDLDVYPFMKALDTHPNVIPIVKEADAKMNFGGAWHTDTSYNQCPPKATVLYAVEVPEEGGDTLFANATAACETLSPGLRSTLEAMTGVFSPKIVHAADGFYGKSASKEELGDAYGGDEEKADQEVEHPLIRTHAETGKKSIYCNMPHTHRIKGWTRDESLALFAFLTNHLTQDEYVTRFQWRRGSLAMWDNRCLFHNALNDYQGKRREMHRVIIQGERPV